MLEIGTTGAANEQGVAGEHPIAHQKAVGIVGMARGEEHIERDALDLDSVAIAEPHRDDIGLTLLAHHGDAAGAVAQRAEAGNVIGVDVGVDRFEQLEVEFVEQLKVTIDLVEDRVDNQRLAAAATGDDIGVGKRDMVEQLAEYHRRPLLGEVGLASP